MAERYQVFARRFRPRTFEEVVGQEPVTRTLCNAIRENRVGHAYLFCGPRGVGKTTLARIFSKAINCVKGPTPEPCDQCDICRAVQEGSDTDVIEMDAASNNSVDDARALRESVGYAPLRARTKIYILDEAHMLSSSAFNALLKTLEEPPPHVKFLFATTEPDKLPDTIRSRCQRFDFRRVTHEDVVSRLKQIASRDNLTIGEDIFSAVAAHADGSVRDAESLLDQIVSLGPSGWNEEQTLALLGRVRRETLEALAKSLAAGDVAAALSWLDQVLAAGADPAALLRQITDHYRGRLRGERPEPVLYALQVLIDVPRRLRDGADPRLLLEVTLARLARSADLLSVPELLRELRGGEPVPEKRPASPAPTPAPRPEAPAPAGFEGLKRHWRDLVGDCGRERGLLALLHDARPASLEGDVLTIDLPEEVAGRAPEFDSPAARAIVERHLGRALGKTVRVRYRATDAPPPPAPEPKTDDAGAARRILDAFPGARIVEGK